MNTLDEKNVKLIILLFLVLATIFCSLALFIPWAGYTNPLTGQFISVENYLSYHPIVVKSNLVNNGSPQDSSSQIDTFFYIAMFIRFTLPFIVRIITPVLGFFALVVLFSKRESRAFTLSISAGTAAIISIIFYWFFLASVSSYMEPSGNTLYSGYGLYAAFSWSFGFYLFIVGTILFFTSAGLVNYFISLNVEDEHEETQFVKKRKATKNFCSECGAKNDAEGKFCKQCGTKL